MEDHSYILIPFSIIFFINEEDSRGKGKGHRECRKEGNKGEKWSNYVLTKIKINFIYIRNFTCTLVCASSLFSPLLYTKKLIFKQLPSGKILS